MVTVILDVVISSNLSFSAVVVGSEQLYKASVTLSSDRPGRQNWMSVRDDDPEAVNGS
jgi:hypothetical protein